MTGFLTLINIVFFTGLSLFFLILCLSSFFEKEIRAALIALIFMVLNT
ncbi:MAG: hypothetical protein GY860_05480, partial [Desulfobacteraceae bacterium]|nr:hypothetical protein [Desulfobacteraceae bacterium]